MNFKTIKNLGESRLEVKKSIFIGTAKSFENEQNVKDFIKSICSKYNDARHNCFAFILGSNNDIQRYNDNGEPSGSAGMPILESIKKKEVTNTVVIVTRYFGGILLGSSGLYRAYSSTASMAIENALIVEKVLGVIFSLTIPYNISDKFEHHIEKENYYIENKTYTDFVTFNFYIESVDILNFKSKIISITNNNITFNIEDERYFFKNENRLYL